MDAPLICFHQLKASDFVHDAVTHFAGQVQAARASTCTLGNGCELIDGWHVSGEGTKYSFAILALSGPKRRAPHQKVVRAQFDVDIADVLDSQALVDLTR